VSGTPGAQVLNPAWQAQLAQGGICLVGGGMVGATLALMLARSLPEVPLLLLESAAWDLPAQDAPEDGRSSALSPSAQAAFVALGLWPSLSGFSTAIRTIHVSDQGRWGLSQFRPSDNRGEPLGYVVENAGLVAVLKAALAAQPQIHVLTGAQVTQLQPQPGAMGLAVSWQGQRLNLSSQLLVLADGAESPLRRQLGMAVQQRDYQQTALVANVRFSRPHQGVAFERFCPQGPMALLPRGLHPEAQEGALIWTFPSTGIAEALSASDSQLLAQLQAAFGYRLGRFLHIGKRQAYPLQLVVAQEQVRPNLVLQGNAAHFLHPVAGQGFNLSLRDGLRLAQVLAEGHQRGQALGDVRLLHHYWQQQQADQRATIALSHGFNRVFSGSQPLLRTARNLGMLALEVLPPLRQAFISQLSGQASQPARLGGEL
jgi:2-octaprenyl-6-methoxyphenol hydroxylase